MKPYIILHMLISIDGKITGDYMNTDTASALCEEYYRINREYLFFAHISKDLDFFGENCYN